LHRNGTQKEQIYYFNQKEIFSQCLFAHYLTNWLKILHATRGIWTSGKNQLKTKWKLKYPTTKKLEQKAENKIKSSLLCCD